MLHFNQELVTSNVLTIDPTYVIVKGTCLREAYVYHYYETKYHCHPEVLLNFILVKYVNNFKVTIFNNGRKEKYLKI